MTARLAAGSEKLASARMGISFSHNYPTPDPAPPPPSITHGQFTFGLPRSRIFSQACTTYAIGQNAVASSTSRCYCTLPFRAQMSEKSPGRPRLLFVRKPMSSRQSNISMRRHSSDVQSHCSRLPPSPTIAYRAHTRRTQRRLTDIRHYSFCLHFFSAAAARLLTNAPQSPPRYHRRPPIT